MNTQTSRYAKQHREKLNAYMRKYRRVNTVSTIAARRKYHLNAKYGLTVAEYQLLYFKQGGHCKICGEQHETLHIDHNHKTGTVRALLCKQCNFMLGNAKDKIEILQQAINYLEQYDASKS